MMAASEEWRDLCRSFLRYGGTIDRLRTAQVNSRELKEQTKLVAQVYFRSVRPLLLQFQLEDLVEPLTAAFQALLELSEGRNLTASYKRHVKTIRRLIPKITSQLELQGGSAPSVSSSTTDRKIIDTLDQLIPSAGLSYQQAIADLSDARRASFRGPAHELREALREVLDHLAPDANMKEAQIKFEKDHNGKERTTYTMKQKVRFIFKAREQSMTDSAVPEKATNTIDELIADMTRSTYDRGSLSAHKERGKKSVEQLKRYVDALFHDLLEI
ncbi:pPIWI-associating nuclease domain-containing protein [Bradyrhizobium sp. USDA 4529]